MGIRCMALLDHTERPETITIGTNELLGTSPRNIDRRGREVPELRMGRLLSGFVF